MEHATGTVDDAHSRTRGHTLYSPRRDRSLVNAITPASFQSHSTFNGESSMRCTGTHTTARPLFVRIVVVFHSV